MREPSREIRDFVLGFFQDWSDNSPPIELFSSSDARVPHEFANGGRKPLELLIIFGPQGERVRLRTRPTTNKTPPAIETA